MRALRSAEKHLVARWVAIMNRFSAPRWHSVEAAHEAQLRHCLLTIVVALCSLLLVGGPGVRAQAGTLTADQDVASAAECTAAPRSEDELRALFRKAAATPIPTSLELAASPTPAIAPLGDPADEQTVAEISATWREFIACISAGDQARLFALFSDDMVLRQFVVDIAFGVTEDALFDFLSATPVPLPLDQSATIVPFDDVRVLSDGRVAVVGPGELGRGDIRIFVKEGDRWLLDEWFDLTANGTPAAGPQMIEPTPYG
jgi:hypothetical protein